MRLKTESKRIEIINAAAVEFAERGFQRTTLMHVAQRMKSSKATIYNYFRSKEELFWAMLADAAKPATADLLKMLDLNLPLAERLAMFARGFVEMHSTAMAISLQRLLIGEHDKSPASTQPLRDDPEIYVWPYLNRMFRAEQGAGNLVAGETGEMVTLLRALLHGDIPFRLLFGERDDFTAAEKRASADSAVRLFLQAYATR